MNGFSKDFLDIAMLLILAAILLGIWTHAPGFAQATNSVSGATTSILGSVSH